MGARAGSSRLATSYHALFVAPNAGKDLDHGESSSSSEGVVSKTLPPVSRLYVERPEIQSRMTQLLLPTDERRQQPRCILHGIGGAGKTQLATKWITDHEDR